ncbi:hypothetical protein [Catelliglobosispora koreensis]|uniref:hypothetical protein n=1 Tax=Catelliglobosispora koreensis TaxID=129052 RepID=UPI0012F852C4|nr:hypothetical protein [Catelliglobosispora koreensis]
MRPRFLAPTIVGGIGRSAGEDILTAALWQAHAADGTLRREMIVIGTRGSQDIAVHAECTVLLVPSNNHDNGESHVP